jgi:hypothetical protein
MLNNCCRRMLTYLSILFIAAFFNECSVAPPKPPPSAACTFSLSNMFVHCHNPTSGSGIISYRVQLVVSFYSGSRTGTLDEEIKTSTSPPGSNMTITSKLPTNGTPYTVNVTISGTQCARCALPEDANGFCPQNPTTLNGFSAHTAAYPVYQYTAQKTGYQSTWGISTWAQISNVAGTCDCVVED